MVIGIIFFIFWVLDIKISLNMMEKYEAYWNSITIVIMIVKLIFAWIS